MGSGYEYCGISEDDKTWCWSRNDFNAFNLIEQNAFGIKDLNVHINKLFIGMHGLCGLDEKGEVYCWKEAYGKSLVKIPVDKLKLGERIVFEQRNVIGATNPIDFVVQFEVVNSKTPQGVITASILHSRNPSPR